MRLRRRARISRRWWGFDRWRDRISLAFGLHTGFGSQSEDLSYLRDILNAEFFV